MGYAIVEGAHAIRPPYNPRDDLPACPPVVSMDAVRSGDDANLGHLTIDHREPPADARTLADEDRVTARQILSLLGGRHAEILARRYGVGPGPGAGEVGAGAIVRYEVLSRELGVSKEGARQAVERAAEAARARVRVAKAGARGGDVRRSLAGMGRGA